MVNITISLRTYTEKSGVIWITFYVSRERVNLSTKISIDPKDWNERTCRIKSSDKHASDKNLILENMLARINNVFVKYRLKDKKLTKDMFLRAYHRPSDYNTFYDYVTAAQKKISYQTEMSTFCTHNSVIRKMKEYAPQLTFDDITKEWLDNYFLYLRKELDNNSNTAYKNMGTIKKYVRMAYRDGYMDENPFEDWKIKNTTASCVYLTEDELNTLISMYCEGLLEYRYHQALQFFLFLCFSSLHITDAKKLQLEQFTQTSFTYFRVKLKNRKPAPVVVPISAPLESLLRDIVGPRKKGPIFDKLPADQTMNRYLKEIAKMAEIDKPLTHKVGRHTFATIFLRKTKDIAALKEILGHSDISETLVYAHVLDESKQEGIQCFNQFSI